MQVRDILKQKGNAVVTIRSDKSVQDAVNLLMEKRFGSLLVSDRPNEIAGIITERDVLRECAKDSTRLAERKVSEAMSKAVVTASPDDTIKAVQRLMIEKRIRHLPIVEKGQLVGMISIGDVMKVLLDATEAEAKDLRDFLVEKNVVA